MARAPLVVLSLLTLLTSGCVSSNGGSGSADDTAATASPRRYDADPDKPKRVCESTMEGNEPKTICY